MSETWGAPGGIDQAEQAQQRMMLANLSGAHQLGEIAMQPDKARLLGAQAGEAELKLANEQAMQKVMMDLAAKRQGGALAGGGAPGTPTAAMASLASPNEEIGMALVNSGQFVKGSAFLKDASLIRAREARAADAAQAARMHRFNADIQQADTFERMIRDVPAGDQEGYARANALFAMRYGEQNPLANQPFTQELKDQLASHAVSLKDKAKQDAIDFEYASRDEARQARREQTKVGNEFRERAQRLREQAEDRRAKAGGKSAGSPTKDQMSDAMSLLKKEVPDLDTKADDTAAIAIASEARLLMQKNRGLSWNEAMNQALGAAKEAGDFETTPGRVYGTNTKYNPGLGRSAAKPITTWTPGTEKKGKFYRNAKGQVAEAVGDGKMRIVQAAPPTGGRPGEVSGRIGSRPLASSADSVTDGETDDALFEEEDE